MGLGKVSVTVAEQLMRAGLERELEAARCDGAEAIMEHVGKTVANQDNSCITMNERSGRLTVVIEIPYPDEDPEERCFLGTKRFFADVLRAQYPTCHGSTEQLLVALEGEIGIVRKALTTREIKNGI